MAAGAKTRTHRTRRLPWRAALVTALLAAGGWPPAPFAIARGQNGSGAGELARFRQQGIALLEQGQAREALARFRAVVTRDPGDAVAHDYIGRRLGRRYE